MTQAAALKMLPIRVGRGLAIALVTVAALALVGLAFAVGRWTADTSAGAANTQTTAPIVWNQPVQPIQCHVVARPC
jgi:hypothetical protein